MNKKLFLIDLDNTSLTSEKKFTPYFISIVKKIIQQNHLVALITGRPMCGCLRFHQEIKANAPLVALNGNKILDVAKNKKLVHNQIFNGDLLNFINHQKISNIIVDFGYSVNKVSYLTNQEKELINLWEHERKKVILPLEKLKKTMPKQVDSAFIIIDYLHINLVTNVLNSSQKFYFHKWQKDFSSKIVFEIFSIKGDKGKASEILAKYLNIDLQDVVAFGDGENDIPMFKVVKNSFAVVNCSLELKKYASSILTLSNDQDAVAKKLDDYLK